MAFPLLSSTFQLAGVTVPNRTVMAPMSSSLATPSGAVTPAQIEYYRTRAAGGTGLILVEFTCVAPKFGRAEPTQLCLDSEANLEGHRQLVKAIEAQGSVSALQLHLPGQYADIATLPPDIDLPIAPSEVFSRFEVGQRVARALSTDEIHGLVESFRHASELAVAAGYQAIEIHGAHGYLPMAFLSPLKNQRTDEWGGDFKRRLNFPRAIIAAVKKAIGPSRALIYRLSFSEELKGGLTLEDMEAIVPHLADAGADAIDVSSGSLDGRLYLTVEPMSFATGWRLEATRRLRKKAGIPVIGIGFRWPENAEHALERGDVDLIALGRPLLADPDWPNKAFAGNINDIRPCTNCNWCFDRVLKNIHPIGCAENPRAGQELNIPKNITPIADIGRRAVVVGAGPGGMVAALELDQAGFETHLIEARPELGGGLIVSTAPPLKEKLSWYLTYLKGQIGKSTVQNHLNWKAEGPDLLDLNSDIAIVATGARTDRIAITGNDQSHVFDAYDILIDDSALRPPKAGRILVYGGGETGCETAEYLAAKGYAIVLVTRSQKANLARNAEPMYRKLLRQRLAENPAIEIRDSATITNIGQNSVTLISNDHEEALDMAQIVLAQGRKSGSTLPDFLTKHGIPTVLIGDAQSIGRIGDAVHQAHAAVYKLIQTLEEMPHESS